MKQESEIILALFLCLDYYNSACCVTCPFVEEWVCSFPTLFWFINGYFGYNSIFVQK